MSKFNAFTRADCAREISKRTGYTQKDIINVISALCDVIKENVTVDTAVVLKEIGRFYVTELNERRSRNPKTGEELIAKPKLKPKFKPADSFYDAVNIPKEG